MNSLMIYLVKKERKNLVICESPPKLKKIQSFLGDNYIVKVVFGHIRDLEKKSISQGRMVLHLPMLCLMERQSSPGTKK